MSEFVDQAQLNVRAGDGGAGCMSFRRETHVPEGGPDGGDGGKGGDIWLRANRNVASLLGFRDHPHRKAERGTHGQGKKMHGKAGADMVVDVPVGTMVRDFEGEVLADLAHDGDTWLAAAGGTGGRGNARFLSNARRAPSFAEQGEYGQERWLELELKLLADAALVGFPNAGKSTLIAAISAARPKIADYPFTTLIPNLGVVRFDEHEYVVADIPGLIEGAAEGKGLGHEFLRHVERARVLVILLDLAAWDRSPEEQERILLGELEGYQPDLLERPRLVVGSKFDVANPDAVAWFREAHPEHPQADEYGIVPDVTPGILLSAATRHGLERFQGELGSLVDGARASEPDPESWVVLKPTSEGFTVAKDDDGTYRVTGRSAERVVAMADLTNREAMDYVQHRLKRMGVDRALARAGARQGDVVRIGPVELEWADDGVMP